MPKLTINDQEIEVAPGTSIIQAAEQIGVEIPRFCYHDKLSVPANCRMCLVEVVGGPPKPVASCAMACGEGMVVKTESEMVKKARKGVMEMLLINHPLDCPICDQGGECDLQDQAVAYGWDRSRYHENKRAVKDKNLGPTIKTIMTRCINCTRCVRFGEEIAGMTELGQLNRSENAEIGTFIEKAVTTELSGNMIDICPVGALTSKPYAFKARSWELKKTESVDVHDAVGCNIRIDSRGGEVMRILPRLNENINEEWINDRTRFAYDGLTKNRLDQPYIRNDKTGKLNAASWDEALKFIANKLSTFKKDNISAFVGDMADAESIYALKSLMNNLDVGQLECRVDGAKFDTTNKIGYRFNSTIAGIENATSFLLVGTNPRHEGTLINTRIRKTWMEKRLPITLIGEAVDLTYPYHHAGTSPQDLKKFIEKAKNLGDRPMIIVGMGAFQREDGLEIHGLVKEVAEKLGMVTEEWNGFNILHNAASRMAALELGFTPARAFDINEMGLVYLLGVDNSETVQNINPLSFVIYQGHHGDAGAHRADVILPGAAYTEKDGIYLNMEGCVQRGRKATFPPGDAKEDWSIIRALSNHMEQPLPFNNLSELRSTMIAEFPSFGAYDEITPAKWGSFGGAAHKASKDPFVNPIQNFYMTNVICKASDTMRRCTESFVNPKILEAAE